MKETVNKLKDISIKFELSSGKFCNPKKKSNSRKSMASLFVYLILIAADMPLTQAKILDKLSKYPYEINIERKALSRIIHGLEDAGIGIISDKSGTRYDESLVWNA